MHETRGERISWKDVAEAIRSGIDTGKFGEGSKLPSEAALMTEHGASKMTVHRALRELTSEGLVRRVERIGTFVKGPGEPVARKIGLILPTTEGYLEFNMLAGVRDVLDAGEQYLLYATENDPIAEYEALNRAANEVDGVLIFPMCNPRSSRRIRQLHEEGFPVVCLDRTPLGLDLHAVASDNYQASYNALSALLKESRHRVGYFGIYDDKVSSLTDRYRAYEDVCASQGDWDSSEYVRFIPPHVGPHAKVSFRLLEDALIRLLTADQPMTLAFCANEYYLEAIVHVCHDLPPELWKRLEILSFNDWPRLRYQGFRVHTIRQNARGIGSLAADLLHRILKGEEVTPERHEVPASFTHADDSNEFGSSMGQTADPGGRSLMRP